MNKIREIEEVSEDGELGALESMKAAIEKRLELRKKTEHMREQIRSLEFPGSTRSLEMQMAARQFMPYAIEKLASQMDAPKAADSIAACREILDRGYGKATQRFDIVEQIGQDPIELEKAAKAIITMREAKRLKPVDGQSEEIE